MAGQAGQDEGDFEWGDNAVGGSEDRAQLLASVTAVEHGLAQQNQDTKASADQGGILASALTCCSVDSLKPYFDPATDAVVKQRILLAVAAPIYLRPGNGQEGFLESAPADLYGPLWVPLTFGFVLAAAGNVHRWGRGFESDFHLMITGLIFAFGYLIVVALIIVFSGRLSYVKLSCSFVHALCISGYALCAFIPGAALSAISMFAVPWIALTLAAAFSTLFLVMEGGGLSSAKSSQLDTLQPSVTGFVVVMQLAFVIAMKLIFF